MKSSDGNKIIALDDVVAVVRRDNFNFERSCATIHLGNNVRVALVIDFDDLGANSTQHVSKQTLGTKAEFDVADFGPKAAKD